eukprot:CAMPEP_0177628390 /NCGR_PEP_ID=MMETSP0447-20121125/106_1 /TAXON_ID=0 /ORGANISM="Stygamoeba regulata, Strain BSH-02190019" /LENGTH=359 /DNA_ID=CAMNT_0019129635 /DNA_START=55 /DNA_END=1131 /DNA_ORIENTATION=-
MADESKTGITIDTEADITVEFLAAVLKQPVTAVTISPGSENIHLGRIFRVKLTYDGEGDAESQPSSVVVKVTNAEPALVSYAKSLKFFERECYFYSKLAPLLRSKCSITNLPICYASHQHEDGRSYLVLEDLAPGSAYSLTEGCSNLEAQEAILQLAALHAGFYKLNKEDPSLCSAEWAKLNATLFDHTNFEKYVHTFLTNHKEIIDSGWDEFLVDLTSSIHAILKEMEQGPQSIMHCDFKLENIFYGEATSEKETGRTSVLDWQTYQMAGLVGMAADVSNFLVTSLFIKQRRSHEKHLLNEYYNAFMTGTDLDSDEYTFEQFMRNFVLGIQWQCFMVVFSGGRFKHSSGADDESESAK